MKPLYVRSLTKDEHRALKEGLRSKEAFTLRRCQILLASASGKKASEIRQNLKCASQTVRNAIRAFNQQGLASLQEGSRVPVTVKPVLDEPQREQLRAILHQSPRNFGKTSSLWTLKLVAEVCYEQGLTPTRLSAPTILDAIERLGVRWKRAKRWINSPDPAYALKKSNEIA